MHTLFILSYFFHNANYKKYILKNKNGNFLHQNSAPGVGIEPTTNRLHVVLYY